MSIFYAILAILQLGAFIAIVVAVVRSEMRRRREEREDRLRYKTGLWME